VGKLEGDGAESEGIQGQTDRVTKGRIEERQVDRVKGESERIE
jgi:hypothetical protein